ncbi:aldehyde dehydrogenase family protein [Pseudonocardia sp. GCM10023141]|uniref:aldehyde dehydrogenase family protein n=1 Tax=Pseudonocardia sp. GCM10023141 TaxID=3252653 RepID=UPI00360CDCAE
MVEVVNPATEKVIGHVPNGTAGDVDAAVSAARRAFDPDIDLRERRRRVSAIIDATARHLPAIAALITAEMGAPVRIAEGVQTQVPMSVARGTLDVLDQPHGEERIGNSPIVRTIFQFLIGVGALARSASAGVGVLTLVSGMHVHRAAVRAGAEPAATRR